METLNGIRLAALLYEGLPWVAEWTPTEINSGGAGIFAMLLSDQLSEVGIEHEIILLYDKRKDGTEGMVRAFVAEGRIPEGRLGWAHIMVKVQDSFYVDADGFMTSRMENLEWTGLQPITYEQTRELWERGDWNPVFDREMVGLIKAKLRKLFTYLPDFHQKQLKWPTEGQVEMTEYTREQQELAEKKKRGMVVLSIGNLASIFAQNKEKRREERKGGGSVN